ncbi:hypothetical protein Efla_004749 [Eimeria flavescens]
MPVKMASARSWLKQTSREEKALSSLRADCCVPMKVVGQRRRQKHTRWSGHSIPFAHPVTHEEKEVPRERFKALRPHGASADPAGGTLPRWIAPDERRSNNFSSTRVDDQSHAMSPRRDLDSGGASKTRTVVSTGADSAVQGYRTGFGDGAAPRRIALGVIAKG